MKDAIEKVMEELDKDQKELFLEWILYLEEGKGEENLRRRVIQIIENGKKDKLFLLMEKLERYKDKLNLSDFYKIVMEAFGKVFEEMRDELKTLRSIIQEHKEPIIQLKKGVLLVPIVGILDSQRAEMLAEDLLKRIVDTKSLYVIIDVTGIATIDTIVAGFLIEVFKSIRLLGALPILCGIHPNVAHSLVKVGVNLDMLKIKMDLEEAIKEVVSHGDK